MKACTALNAEIMRDPARLAGRPANFLCGNDEAAKAEVVALLQSFGWADPVEQGDIGGARGMEGLMPFWIRLWRAPGRADYNDHIAGR